MCWMCFLVSIDKVVFYLRREKGIKERELEGCHMLSQKHIRRWRRNSFSGGESEHNTVLPLVHNHTRPRKHPHFTGNHRRSLSCSQQGPRLVFQVLGVLVNSRRQWEDVHLWVCRLSSSRRGWSAMKHLPGRRWPHGWRVAAASTQGRPPKNQTLVPPKPSHDLC